VATTRTTRAALVDGMGTFDTNIQELSDWVDAHNGQMPSAEAEDPTERRNGQFLADCRRAASGRAAGPFSAERRALLDQLVPGLVQSGN